MLFFKGSLLRLVEARSGALGPWTTGTLAASNAANGGVELFTLMGSDDIIPPTACSARCLRPRAATT